MASCWVFLFTLVKPHAYTPVFRALRCPLKRGDTAPTIRIAVKHDQGWRGLPLNFKPRYITPTHHSFLQRVHPLQTYPNFIWIAQCLGQIAGFDEAQEPVEGRPWREPCAVTEAAPRRYQQTCCLIPKFEVAC